MSRQRASDGSSKWSDGGHTLVEVLVALTVMSIGLVAVLSMLLLSSSLARQAARRGGAAIAAVRTLDRTRAEGAAPPIVDTTSVSVREGDYVFRVWLTPLDSGRSGPFGVAVHGPDMTRILRFDPARTAP